MSASKEPANQLPEMAHWQQIHIQARGCQPSAGGRPELDRRRALQALPAETSMRECRCR
ncbi:MAG: hypothetical protein KME26_23130 [Oscillatoria princeps RMCB-10]|nr:hypothetical protein [Oscillatoria princeps RMCB-10]